MDPKILYSLSYGMYAVGVKGETRPSACIANTVFQVTAFPSVIAVSINHDNYTNECIKKSNIFTVSVFSEDTSGTVIGALGFNSGKKVDKLKNIKHRLLKDGYPIIEENCCCWLLCNVINSIETDTHTVFFAEVIDGSEKSIGKPMTYSYYHNVIKGCAPKNAPTYQEVTSQNKLNSYVCTICGYVYSNQDTPFDDLPENWVCPICGAPRSVFKVKI